MSQSETGLYIHVPFCSKRCAYCDFFSLESFDRNLINSFGRKTIETVLERIGEFDDFSTIYIGGGSPSMLSAEFFKEISKTVLKHDKFRNIEEFTVELNPADIDESWLKVLAENGVNRISAGIQAMDDDVLIEMGRRTTASDINRNLPLISKYFKNISVDFIYGLGKNRDLKKEMSAVFQLADISHVSAYQYTKPEKDNTPSLIDEDEMLKQECDIRKYLKEKGFERYEISNYSKNGKTSLHNMIYWSYGSWLGIGPGAHSFNCKKGEHSFYQSDVAEFMNDGGLSRFIPSKNELMEEFVLMGLRTVEGIDIKKFEKVFGSSFYDAYRKNVIEEFISDGFLVIDKNKIVCTQSGFDLLNGILLKIFESGER